MIKKTMLMIGTLLLVLSCVTKEPELVIPDKPAKDGYLVKGYLPVWNNWSAEDIKGDELTEIILSFALVYKDELLTTKIKTRQLEEMKKLREMYPHLHISFAIGGWGADGFSDAVLTEESREKFTQSIADYVIEHNYDSVDIDWEFPVNGGWGAIKARPEDRENHTLFLYLLREKLDIAGAKLGKYIGISVAANQGEAYYKEWVEIEKVAAVVDYLHLMTYDGAGGWSSKTEHHTGVALTEDTVKRFIDAGVPAEKLVVGGAFYGKLMQGVNFEADEPVGASFSEDKKVSDVDYTRIKEYYLNEPGYEYGWDENPETGRAPYIWNKEKGIYITYDDPRSIKEKSEIVKQYGLAGAMFWDYNQDKTGDLLGAFHSVLLKNN